jgi:hypothetical protein
MFLFEVLDGILIHPGRLDFDEWLPVINKNILKLNIIGAMVRRFIIFLRKCNVPRVRPR